MVAVVHKYIHNQEVEVRRRPVFVTHRIEKPRQRWLHALQAALDDEVAVDAAETTQLIVCNTETDWNEVAG